MGHWWCFQLETGSWGCAPGRRTWEQSSGTSESPGNPESLWMPNSYLDTRQAGGGRCFVKYWKSDVDSLRIMSSTEKLTWITTRGDCEKYHSGRPKRLMRAVLVSYVSEQRVLRMLPPAGLREKSISWPSVIWVMSSKIGSLSTSTDFWANMLANAKLLLMEVNRL